MSSSLDNRSTITSLKCAWWNIVHPERREVAMPKARVGGSRRRSFKRGHQKREEGVKRHRLQARSTSGGHRISNKRIGVLDETKAHIGLSKGIDPQHNQASEGRRTRRLMLSERLMSSVAIADRQTGPSKGPSFKIIRPAAWRRAAFQHDVHIIVLGWDGIG